MSSRQPVVPSEEALDRGAPSELARTNRTLADENERLRRECALLAQRAADAERVGELARENRRAALNLMEDAVEARRKERHENDERRRMEDALRDADRRKDEFLATLAHELRGPLAPVRNSLHVLRLPDTSPETAERLHQVIERQVAHMARLVEDLMEVSRITRGRIELRKERVELASVVQTAIETTRPLFQAGQHTLDVDPVRMAQVLSNLLSNAAKYTDDGGRITVTATRDAASVRISVRDTGVGIPREMLTKVFELFAQAERTYDRAQGGLGIGLTLARSLVQLHGGTITADSDGAGCGTEILVTLPALEQPEAVPAEIVERADASAQGLGLRVLVVDDNEDSAETLALLLTSLGAEVRTANDGQAALDAIRAHRPDVVVLDIGMPRMDGHEVARRARQTAEGRAAKLVALTGWGQDEDRRRTKEAGFDHHLVKPVDVGVLRALLVGPRDLP